MTDASATVLARESFGAWGARRAANWQGSPSPGEWQQIANTTRRGYTGHEQLDNVLLVHMNGRVYDPAIGRFMSADPYGIDEWKSQSWNRYAYVQNRPLLFTDPTGFKEDDKPEDKIRCKDCSIPVEMIVEGLRPRDPGVQDRLSNMHLQSTLRQLLAGRSGTGGDGSSQSNGKDPKGKCKSQEVTEATPGPVNHNESQTAAFLREARNQASLREMYQNHSGSGRFDFVTSDYFDDTFTVLGFRYNAGQFGNFLAGYSGAYHASFPGYFVARVFGVLYDMAEEGIGTDFDAESISYIQDGAALGQLDRDKQDTAESGCPGS